MAWSKLKNIWKTKSLASIILERVTEPFLRFWENHRAIIHKWGEHGTAANFPRGVRCSKITPITHQRLIKKVTKEPRTIFKELHVSVSVTSVKVKVHNSIITKRLRKDDIHWWFLRTKPMLTKKNTKTCLTFVLQSWGLSTFWWPQHFEDFWERLSAAKRMAQHRRANL